MKNSTNHNHHFCLDKRGAVQSEWRKMCLTLYQHLTLCFFTIIHLDVEDVIGGVGMPKICEVQKGGVMAQIFR